jgi:hypothetical protein
LRQFVEAQGAQEFPIHESYEALPFGWPVRSNGSFGPRCLQDIH